MISAFTLTLVECISNGDNLNALPVGNSWTGTTASCRRLSNSIEEVGKTEVNAFRIVESIWAIWYKFIESCNK